MKALVFAAIILTILSIGCADNVMQPSPSAKFETKLIQPYPNQTYPNQTGTLAQMKAPDLDLVGQTYVQTTRQDEKWVPLPMPIVIDEEVAEETALEYDPPVYALYTLEDEEVDNWLYPDACEWECDPFGMVTDHSTLKLYIDESGIWYFSVPLKNHWRNFRYCQDNVPDAQAEIEQHLLFRLFFPDLTVEGTLVRWVPNKKFIGETLTNSVDILEFRFKIFYKGQIPVDFFRSSAKEHFLPKNIQEFYQIKIGKEFIYKGFTFSYTLVNPGDLYDIFRLLWRRP